MFYFLISLCIHAILIVFFIVTQISSPGGFGSAKNGGNQGTSSAIYVDIQNTESDAAKNTQSDQQTASKIEETEGNLSIYKPEEKKPEPKKDKKIEAKKETKEISKPKIKEKEISKEKTAKQKKDEKILSQKNTNDASLKGSKNSSDTGNGNNHNDKKESSGNTHGNGNGGNGNGKGENPGNGKGYGSGEGSGTGTGIKSGIGIGFNKEEQIASTIENVQKKIMQYWFLPEDVSADITVIIELNLDPNGNITGYKLLNKQNSKEYMLIANSVLRTLNDPRVNPLPISKLIKLDKLILKFCPKDLEDLE